MNKFELDKTMECFGYKKNDSYKVGKLFFYHDDRYFTIVKGQTPLELANIIYHKYDNNKYLIRVGGNNENCTPTGDVYTYHIDTIEGVVAFLIETNNYYSKAQTSPDELETILSMVYQKILENVNPKVSIYDWMLERNNRKEYFKTLLSSNTYLDFKLRKKIENFDMVVSPFCNEDFGITDNNFIVHGYGYAEEDSWFTLTDKESGVKLSTIREKNGFVLKLHIPNDNPYEINVYHYFDKNGEEIAFEKYDETNLTRIEYNLTDKSFGEHYGEKHQATTEDKNFVVKSLEEYITLARNIVAKNIGSKCTEQSLVLNKK